MTPSKACADLTARSANTRCYFVHKRPRNGELAAYFAKGPTGFTQLKKLWNVAVFEFCAGMSLPLRNAPSVSILTAAVFLLRYPFQIARAVVGFVAIDVIDCRPIEMSINKSKSYKRVHKNLNAPRPCFDGNHWIPALRFMWGQWPSPPQLESLQGAAARREIVNSSDVPEVRNFKAVFPIFGRFPAFLHVDNYRGSHA